MAFKDIVKWNKKMMETPKSGMKSMSS